MSSWLKILDGRRAALYNEIMSDKIDDIVIPILRNIQGDIAALKLDVSYLKADVSYLKADVSMLKESVRRIDSKMSSMDSFMAGFHNSLNWQNDTIDHLRGRIETLENKDAPPA